MGISAGELFHGGGGAIRRCRKNFIEKKIQNAQSAILDSKTNSIFDSYYL